MPFSLKISQDVFQMQMDQATDCIPSIITIHDDICMFGPTPEEHDEDLLCLMESAKTHGIVFNSAKCHIRQPQIAFYGVVFTGQGMWVDSTKIQALQDLPAPDSQTKLSVLSRSESTICSHFYLVCLIKQCSYKSSSPNGIGTLLQDAAFQCIKAWICQTLLKVTLAYYDRSKPVVVQTDASKYGLGTALLQGGQPIAFASKTLTDIETHYVNIERVFQFALVWRNSTPYIYGRHVI